MVASPRADYTNITNDEWKLKIKIIEIGISGTLVWFSNTNKEKLLLPYLNSFTDGWRWNSFFSVMVLAEQLQSLDPVLARR